MKSYEAKATIAATLVRIWRLLTDSFEEFAAGLKTAAESVA